MRKKSNDKKKPSSKKKTGGKTKTMGPNPPVAKEVEPKPPVVDRQHLSDLLSENKEPLDDTVAFMLEQWRAALGELNQAKQGQQELQKRLNEVSHQIVQLEGQNNKYMLDITAWEARVALNKAKKEKSVEKASKKKVDVPSDKEEKADVPSDKAADTKGK